MISRKGPGTRDQGSRAFGSQLPKAVHPRSPIPDPVRRLFQWRKLFWLGVSAVAVMAGDVLLAQYGPAMRAAAVETGASFSVSAGSFATEGKAATFAAALDASGLPILVRVRPDDRRYQVLVGPYVSTEEAERAQRRMAAWGLGEARLVVDDTMRSNPQEASVFGFGRDASASVVMVAAAGMTSIVFEMSHTPKQVEARRTGTTAMEVEIGEGLGGRGTGGSETGGSETGGSGTGGRGKGEESGSEQDADVFEPLRLPDGVSLVRELSVQSGDGETTRAHVVIPDGVESRLRLEGRRVYLDLAFPKAPWTIVAPRPKGPETSASDRVEAPQPSTEHPQAPAAAAPAKSVRAQAPAAYREQEEAVVARFTQIEPFLLSAVQTPEPDVLAALAHSLDDVRGSLERTTAPADMQANRQTLLVAIAKAQAALAPSFIGDRRPAVEEAIALFHSH